MNPAPIPLLHGHSIPRLGLGTWPLEGDAVHEMVKAVRGIRLLHLASWPATVQARFLEQWRRGQAALPVVDYPQLDFSDARTELAAIAAAADPQHPLGAYLRESVDSWDRAACLLQSLGTAAAGTESIALYGHPGQALPGQAPVSATALALQLQGDLDGFFGDRVVAVELDPNLIAKAAAGATRIRLRAGSEFSDYDRRQLFHHEALVHSLTALNGRQQPNLPSLALASPRVTAVQEGLATFAEQITGSIDIERLKRISLRIEAIAMALEDVVRFEPLFADGSLAAPRWLPPWIERASGLAGMLAFSLFANRIRLDTIVDCPLD